MDNKMTGLTKDQQDKIAVLTEKALKQTWDELENEHTAVRIEMLFNMAARFIHFGACFVSPKERDNLLKDVFTQMSDYIISYLKEEVYEGDKNGY